MRQSELKDALSRLGWTLRDARKYLHVSRQTVYNWTTGKHRIPYSVELMITRALNEQGE